MGFSALNNTLSLIGRIFDTRQAVRPIYTDTSEKPPFHPSPVRQAFPRVSPEEEGIPSDHIAAFLTELAEDETLNMHSILILRNGKILTEAVFGAQDLQCWKCTFSACKSITSLAIGLLCAEGKLSIDEKITDIFENRISPLARISLRELTVRHLLTMSSGASFNEVSMMMEKDWIKGYFNGSFDIGKFSYNSLNTYILSVILTERTGESLTDYLKPRLFDPLGITNFYWEKSPEGIDKGGWGLYIIPEDMAKIGQLVLQNGCWNGRQLIPADWLNEAAHTRISTGSVSETYDYGYQIWTGRNRDSFLFNGMLGQNVLGLRENGILLLSHAGNSELFQQSNYFKRAEEYFGRPFDDVLPVNTQASRKLVSVLDGLRERPPVPSEPAAKKRPWRIRFRHPAPPHPSLPPECSLLDGVRFDTKDDNAPSVGLMPVILQAVQNNYAAGLRSVSFFCSGETFYLTYAEESESYLLRVGFGCSEESDLTFHGVPYRVRTVGTFTRDEDGISLLKLTVQFCETPVTRIIKLYYTGTSPHLEHSEIPGAPFILSKVLSIKKELVTAPLIGDTLNLVDDDYLAYRVTKKFRPDLQLTPSRIIQRPSVFRQPDVHHDSKGKQYGPL